MQDLGFDAWADAGHCAEIAQPNIPNFVISILLLLGILVSYLPQHIKIIRRRSSQGLSPYFVLLGATSGTCAIANILVLPTSRADIACCKINSAFSCAAGLLGVAQIGVQWACFFLITFLFLIFIPRRPKYEDGRQVGEELEPDYGWREGLAVFSITIFFFFAVFFISVVMIGAFPHHLQRWAVILGSMGGVLACVQYLPQIYMTWHHRHVGSLSIPMMLIQTPGSFVFVASLAVRLGIDGWSTWFVYLVTGVLQGVLLAMALYLNWLERRTARTLNEDGLIPQRIPSIEDENASERDPLLTDSPNQSSHRSSPSRIGATASSPQHPSLGGSNPWYSKAASIISSAFDVSPRPSSRRGTQYYNARSRNLSRFEDTDAASAQFAPNGSVAEGSLRAQMQNELSTRRSSTSIANHPGSLLNSSTRNVRLSRYASTGRRASDRNLIRVQRQLSARLEAARGRGKLDRSGTTTW